MALWETTKIIERAASSLPPACRSRFLSRAVPAPRGPSGCRQHPRNDDLPIRLLPRTGDELNALAAHPGVGGLEVVDAQEQPDPAREVSSDRSRLPLAVRLREQQPARRVGRSHDDPPLLSAVIGPEGEPSTSSKPRTSTK